MSTAETEAFSGSGTGGSTAAKSVFAKVDESGNRVDNQIRGQAPRMFPGKIMASRDSTLIELLIDKDENPKPQPVIIIENIIKQMTDVLEAYKNQEIRVEKLIERVDTLLGKIEATSELGDVVEAYKEVLTTRMRDLDEAVNLIKAFPIVIEGSKGLIGRSSPRHRS